VTKAKTRVEKEKVLIKRKVGVENKMVNTKGKVGGENEKVISKLIKAMSRAPLQPCSKFDYDANIAKANNNNKTIKPKEDTTGAHHVATRHLCGKH